MEKHAMALGYFFFAVFCIFTSSQNLEPLPLRIPLLLAAFVAALVGFGFLASACLPQLRAAKNWFVETANLMSRARDLPSRPSTLTEDRTT